MNMNIHPSASLLPTNVQKQQVRETYLNSSNLLYPHSYNPSKIEEGTTMMEIRTITGGAPFATIEDERIAYQSLVLPVGEKLRTAYALSANQNISVQALQQQPKPIATTALDTGWQHITDMTPEEVAFLQAQEAPQAGFREVLESKLNLAVAVKQLTANNNAQLTDYLRGRGLPEKTIDGVKESFKQFFPHATVLDPKKISLLDALGDVHGSLSQHQQKIVVKGEHPNGSHGGNFVKIYEPHTFADAESFTHQVLLDMELFPNQKTNDFPLILQDFETGVSKNLQLAFTPHYNSNGVNLVDFALADQVFQPHNNTSFLGSISSFDSLASITKSSEEATHLLLSLEAVMHQILIQNGYLGGLPQAVATQALKTFGIDFIHTAKGGIKLIDLNPRTTGTLPCLAQSYQQQLYNKQASTGLLIGGIPEALLNSIIDAEGTQATSNKIAFFIQQQLEILSKTVHQDILPLGTSLVHFTVTKIPTSPIPINTPFSVIAQSVQLVGNQSAEICQKVLQHGIRLAEEQHLANFLTGK